MCIFIWTSILTCTRPFRVIFFSRNTDFPNFSNDTKEFLLRIIEEASQLDDTSELFKSLESDKGPEIIKSLVTVSCVFSFKIGNGSIYCCFLGEKGNIWESCCFRFLEEFYVITSV